MFRPNDGPEFSFDPSKGNLLHFPNPNFVLVYNSGGGKAPYSLIKSRAFPHFQFSRGRWDFNISRWKRSVDRFSKIARRKGSDLPYRADCLRGFLDTCDPCVLKLMTELKWARFPLFSLLSRSEEARELAESNPAIAFMVSDPKRYGLKPVKQEMRRSKSLVRKPRRRLAGLFGFPPTPSTVRILAKVPAADVCDWTMKALHDAFSSRSLVTSFRHLPAINAAALSLCTTPAVRAMANHALLQDVCNQQGTLIGYCAGHLSELWQIRFPNQALPRLRSATAVLELHQELLEQHHSTPRRKVVFPEPPIPNGCFDGLEIRAIRDSVCLRAHAKRQRNCAANMVPDIMHGQCYVYEATAEKERYTLSVLRRRPRGLDGWQPGRGFGDNETAIVFADVPWTLGELRGRFNARAPIHLLHAARSWFQTAFPTAPNSPAQRVFEQYLIHFAEPGDDDVPF